MSPQAWISASPVAVLYFNNVYLDLSSSFIPSTILPPALTSLSQTNPQQGQTCTRIDKPFGTRVPQLLHFCVVLYGQTRCSDSRWYLNNSYSRIVENWNQAASDAALESFRFFNINFDEMSSMATHLISLFSTTLICSQNRPLIPKLKHWAFPAGISNF